MIIEPFAVAETYFVQNFRKSENQMEMFNTVCIFKPVLDPESLLCPLTFGTVAIAAAVIADMFFPTMITTILMTAQGRGATHG